MWQMPADITDYALSKCIINTQFSRNFTTNEKRLSSKIKNREKFLATSLLGASN